MTLAAYARNRMLDLEGISADGLLPHQADALAHGGRSRYSLSRALDAAQERAPLTGLEAETHQELKRRRPSYLTKGVLIPHDVPMPGAERFDLDSTSGAGSLATSTSRTFGAALRSKLVTARLGARVEDFRAGNTGAVAVPVATSAITATWIVEGASTPNPTAPKMSQARGEPHSVAVRLDVTRRMSKQAAPGFEAFIMDDLAAGVAVAVDRAALAGAGVNGEPLGLVYGAWPNFSFSGGTATLAGLSSIKRQVADANADSSDDQRMGWCTSPEGRSALEQLDLGTGSGRFAWVSKAVLDPATGQARTLESVLGVPAAATTAVPSGFTVPTNGAALIYGNWRHMFIQLFDAVDILVDPYSLDASGTVRLRAWQDCDVLFPYRDKSFMTGVVTAPAT